MLGSKIKEARMRKGYTQEMLAHAMGVAKITVAKWETDVMYPGAKNLIRLAQALEVSPEFLTDQEELEQKDSIPQIELMKPEEFLIAPKHDSNIRVIGVIVERI